MKKIVVKNDDGGKPLCVCVSSYTYISTYTYTIFLKRGDLYSIMHILT